MQALYAVKYGGGLPEPDECIFMYHTAGSCGSEKVTVHSLRVVNVTSRECEP